MSKISQIFKIEIDLRLTNREALESVGIVKGYRNIKIIDKAPRLISTQREFLSGADIVEREVYVLYEKESLSFTEINDLYQKNDLEPVDFQTFCSTLKNKAKDFNRSCILSWEDFLNNSYAAAFFLLREVENNRLSVGEREFYSFNAYYLGFKRGVYV